MPGQLHRVGDLGHPATQSDSDEVEPMPIATVLAVVTLLLITPAVAQPLPVPKPPGQQCPSGYASGAHWCTPMSTTTRNAVPKGTGQCPSGWIQSEAFCLSQERRGR